MPSIDLEAGRAVKRIRGVRGTGLVLGDPLELAARLRDAGARWVHVVDLDGAEAGRPVHVGLVRRLKDLGLRVQYGGGLRSLDDVAAAFGAGADRVVLGSAWLRDAGFLERAASLWGDVLAALDERGGRLVGGGWTVESGLGIEEALRMLEGVPVAGYLYTQVDVEGTLRGPDMAKVRRLRDMTSRLLIYAGGVSSLEDLRSLCEAGVDGVVVGMAIYGGGLRLEDALELARGCGRCRPRE